MLLRYAFINDTLNNGTYDSKHYYALPLEGVTMFVSSVVSPSSFRSCLLGWVEAQHTVSRNAFRNSPDTNV